MDDDERDSVEDEEEEESRQLIQVTDDAHFQSLSQNTQKVVVINFLTRGVEHCDSVLTWLDPLANDPTSQNAVFLIVNPDTLPTVARQHGLACVPSYRFLWKRRMLSTFSGTNEEKYKQLLQRSLQIRSSDISLERGGRWTTPIVMLGKGDEHEIPSTLTTIHVGLGWIPLRQDKKYILEPTAYCLDSRGMLATPANCLSPSAPSLASGGMIILGDPPRKHEEHDDVVYEIQLSNVDLSVQEIAFCASIMDGREKEQLLAHVAEMYIRVVDREHDKTLAKYEAVENFQAQEISVELGRLKRITDPAGGGDSWKFVGTADGRALLASELVDFYSGPCIHTVCSGDIVELPDYLSKIRVGMSWSGVTPVHMVLFCLGNDQKLQSPGDMIGEGMEGGGVSGVIHKPAEGGGKIEEVEVNIHELRAALREVRLFCLMDGAFASLSTAGDITITLYDGDTDKGILQVVSDPVGLGFGTHTGLEVGRLHRGSPRWSFTCRVDGHNGSPSTLRDELFSPTSVCHMLPSDRVALPAEPLTLGFQWQTGNKRMRVDVQLVCVAAEGRVVSEMDFVHKGQPNNSNRSIQHLPDPVEKDNLSVSLKLMEVPQGTKEIHLFIVVTEGVLIELSKLLVRVYQPYVRRDHLTYAVGTVYKEEENATMLARLIPEHGTWYFDTLAMGLQLQTALVREKYPKGRVRTVVEH